MPTSTVSLPTETLRSARNTKVYIMDRASDGTAPTAADEVPNVSDVQFNRTGSTTTVEIYGTSYSRAVKTAVNGSLTFSFHASSNNAVAAVILDAAAAIGQDAQVLYLVEEEDGTEYFGAGVVETANPITGVSDALGYEVTITTDGAIGELRAV